MLAITYQTNPETVYGLLRTIAMILLLVAGVCTAAVAGPMLLVVLTKLVLPVVLIALFTVMTYPK